MIESDDKYVPWQIKRHHKQQMNELEYQLAKDAIREHGFGDHSDLVEQELDLVKITTTAINELS
jgi:hypothetical protein